MLIKIRKNFWVIIILLIIISSSISESADSSCGCGCIEKRIVKYRTPVMQGEDVLYLQQLLKEMNYYSGPVEGKYTAATRSSVVTFQRKYDLAPDGIVGPNTWNVLCHQTQQISTQNPLKLPAGERSIVINLYSRRLVLYVNGKPLKSYPVTIGSPDTKSPVGEWIIKNKYVRPNSTGALGSRWLGLNVPWGVYGIHGTNKPWEIGRATSLGCIRLHNEYVEELFELVPVKTEVKIIGKRESVEVSGELRPGDACHEVMELQINLREKGFAPGRLDAQYDPSTQKAVKNLEFQYGLKVDGIADKNVLHILDLLQ